MISITPYNQLQEEAAFIQSELEVTMSEDATEATLRGNILAVYMARTGKMLADAKHHLHQKRSTEVMAILREVAKQSPVATAKAVNALVDSCCRDEQQLVDWLGRLNATATHQLDWCRTLLSKAKEEMRMAGFLPNN